MPKERFHVYLAERLVREYEPGPPVSFDIGAFLIGAVSPDIFYYDQPSFSLSALGDWLHSLIDREGVAPIYHWVEKRQAEKGDGEAISWGLGVACHFLADAIWHPLIEELSGEGLGLVYDGARRLSPIERHRLIESEIEAYWFKRAGESSPGGQRTDYVTADFGGKRGRLVEIGAHYRGFLQFVGGGAPGGRAVEPLPVRLPSARRIARCFLCQNFLLRLFANKTLGANRDLLLSFPPTRFLGALVTPARPVLPALFARAVPEHRNPFSDFFMEKLEVGKLKVES